MRVRKLVLAFNYWKKPLLTKRELYLKSCVLMIGWFSKGEEPASQPELKGK